MSVDGNTPVATAGSQAASNPREDNSVYQSGHVVSRVRDARVDAEAREIHFGEMYNTDELLLSDDCEFRDYRILVKRMDFATREERGAPHKGRVLRGVVAEILGYREQ